MAEPRRLVHPGPVAAERFAAQPCRAKRVRATLRRGLTVLDALTEAADGAPAWADLVGIAVEPLAFVRPAPAPGDGHVAWYSATTTLERARILRAGAHLGIREGAPFAHVHGSWIDGEGRSHSGHLLPSDTILADDAEVELTILDGAILETAHDPETRFDIFRPVRLADVDRPNGVLATIRPNEPLSQAVAEVARSAGMRRARVQGLGSLVGTEFEDSTPVGSYATEILLTEGGIRDGVVSLAAESVGFDGEAGRGALASGNLVCITFEVLLTSGVDA